MIMYHLKQVPTDAQIKKFLTGEQFLVRIFSVRSANPGILSALKKDTDVDNVRLSSRYSPIPGFAM